MLKFNPRWTSAAVMWLFAVFCPPAISQESATVPIDELRAAGPDLSPETVNALVSRLSDSEVRALLLERLNAVTVENDTHALANVTFGVIAFQEKADLIRQRVAAIAASVAELPSVFPRALNTLRADRPASFFFWLTLGFALMMLAGWLAEVFFKKLTANARESILTAAPERLSAKTGYLFARLGLDLMGLLIFLLAAIATFFVFYQGHPMTRVTVMTYVAVIGVIRLFSLFARFLLSPNEPSLRIDKMSDEDARFLHRASTLVAAIAAFGFLTCSLLAILGIAGDVHELMLYLVGFAMTVAMIWMIWRARDGIRNNLLEGINSGRPRQLFADAWPWIAIVFVALFYLLIVILTLAGVEVSYLASFGTLLTVIFLPPVDAMIERTATSFAADSVKGGEFQAVILRAIRIGLMVGAVLFVAGIWEIDFHALATNSIGGRFAGALIDIGFVALVAYVLWEVSRIMIDRRIAAEGGGEAAEMGDEGGTGGTRLGTLLPLIKRTVQITIAVMAVMLVLSALGVNIGPLLAGAGVVGLAVGFGAQTLVRDIVSGIFFLVDDAFRVGEYVDVGSAKGTVEKISIRSFQLRHHRGALNTVPFGEIQTLTNYSRDWVVMKLEFRVPFDTDIAKVKKIFKQIGKDLLEDPMIGDDFLAPFKSQGVFSVDDSALIIRAKFTAKPGKQFLIKREAYQAVQRAFAENGIEFARKQVMVQVPDDKSMTPEDQKKLENAAASALAHPDGETAPAAT